ncbi:hypothetical protein Tco_1142243 [Tanacetum coccineum]
MSSSLLFKFLDKVDIIRENVICLGGHPGHVSACLCHMLYCIETSTPYNLAFFILKRMENTRNKPKELLPYGMLLTRLSCDSKASSSSTTLNHPSSSHLLDDIVDVNDEESFRSNSSSHSQNVSSSSNVVFRVVQNPPHESQHLNTYLSKTIDLQTQHRDDHRKGLRSIGKALKDMMSGKRK